MIEQRAAHIREQDFACVFIFEFDEAAATTAIAKAFPLAIAHFLKRDRLPEW